MEQTEQILMKGKRTYQTNKYQTEKTHNICKQMKPNKQPNDKP